MEIIMNLFITSFLGIGNAFDITYIYWAKWSYTLMLWLRESSHPNGWTYFDDILCGVADTLE